MTSDAEPAASDGSLDALLESISRRDARDAREMFSYFLTASMSVEFRRFHW